MAVYCNTLFNGFVYDDNGQIIENRWIKDLNFIPVIFTKSVAGFSVGSAVSYYRPIMYLIYIFNYHFFGLDPWGYHLVNILLHCVVSILVFMVAAKLLDKPTVSGTRYVLPPSFIAAILFATHTIHTEAVAWVAAVPDLSYALFYLLSLYLYMRAADNDSPLKKPYYVLSIVSFFVAALCKEPALTLPFILFIYDYTCRKAKISDLFKRLINYVPYLIVAAVYFVLRWRALGGLAPSVKHEMSAFQYAINVFPLFSDYLGKLLIPINLSALYTFNPISSLFEGKAVFSLSITTLFLGGCVIAYRKNRLVFFGLMVIVVPLLPALYIPGLADSPLAERYLYLPSVGFVLLAGICYSWTMSKVPKKAVFSIVLAVAVLYSVGSISRNKVWRDDYSLWSDVVRKNPDSAMAHGNLGYAFYKRGMMDEAIEQYLTGLQINPEIRDAHLNLGAAYTAKNRLDEAMMQYQVELSRDAASFPAHVNLADVYERKGLISQAVEEYRVALRIAPDSARAHSGLGILLVINGQVDEGIGHLEAAVRLAPDNAAYMTNLEKAYGLKGSKP
jgi:tetratricopeptide (TPR) repeat protein